MEYFTTLSTNRITQEKECIFLGRSTLDLLHLVEQFPEEDAKTMATGFLAQAGGPALNAAITFAFLGGTPLLISAVGRGPWSDIVKAELHKYDVPFIDICDVETFSPPISSVIINARSGSRTIFNSPAVVAKDSLRVPACDRIASRLLLSDGFYTSELRDLLHDFPARGGMICLDGGSWKPDTEELLSLVSIAICSERFRPPGSANNEDSLDYLITRGIRFAAITRGKSDILAAEDGRRFCIPAEKIAAMDTLGAGDILHGAFCWYFLHSGNFEMSLRAASKISTLSCRFFGAREWMKHCAREITEGPAV